MQSTIVLFRRLYNELPPLVPEATTAKMAHALSHLEGDPNLSVEAVEDTMIAFGFEIWPYNQAFRETVAFVEAQLGEHFLLPKVSSALAKRYEAFKAYGGTLRDLHSGRPADFFTAEERTELCVGLVEMRQAINNYARRQVVGTEKKKYQNRVREFTAVLAEMKEAMEQLRKLANTEEEHPMLAAEIRSRIRHFELGLCDLAPEVVRDAVCDSVDYFRGRKTELNRMRGIHNPITLDWSTM